MLDLEPIKDRLAWVNEEGLNGYTWDIKDTYRQYRDLVAEVERLRPLAEAARAFTEACEEVIRRVTHEASQRCQCDSPGIWCRPCWCRVTLTGDHRTLAEIAGHTGDCQATYNDPCDCGFATS